MNSLDKWMMPSIGIQSLLVVNSSDITLSDDHPTRESPKEFDCSRMRATILLNCFEVKSLVRSWELPSMVTTKRS